MAEQFGEFIATVRVEDQQLRTALHEDVALAASSAEKVQSSMNKMEVAAKSTTEQVGKLQLGLAAAGAAGSLAGSSFGGMASAAAGFAGAINALNLGLGPVGIGIAAVGLAFLQFKDVLFDTEDQIDKTTSALDKQKNAIVSYIEDVHKLAGGTDAELIAALGTKAAELRDRRELLRPVARGVGSEEFQRVSKDLLEVELRRRTLVERFNRSLDEQEQREARIAVLKEEQNEERRRAIRLQTDVLRGTISEEEAILRSHDLRTAIALIDQKRAADAKAAAGAAGVAAGGAGGVIGTIDANALRGGGGAAIAIGQQNIVAKNTGKLVDLNSRMLKLMAEFKMEAKTNAHFVGGPGLGSLAPGR